MKKRIAVLAAFCVLFSFAGCKGAVGEPTTVPEETVENASGQTVSDSDAASAPAETTSSAETTSAAETTTAPEVTTATTVPVTFVGDGIPVANAYFSIMLPASWDGRYRSATAYDGDVMTLAIKDKDSADAGAGGVLFTLALVPAGAVYEQENLERLYTLQGAADTYTLYVFYPEEEQTTPETQQQYAAMQQQIDDALATLKPGEGYRF